MKVYHGHIIMILNSMDEICVFSERVEVGHYYNYDTERKNVRHPLFQIRSHTLNQFLFYYGTSQSLNYCNHFLNVHAKLLIFYYPEQNISEMV